MSVEFVFDFDDGAGDMAAISIVMLERNCGRSDRGGMIDSVSYHLVGDHCIRVQAAFMCLCAWRFTRALIVISDKSIANGHN